MIIIIIIWWMTAYRETRKRWLEDNITKDCEDPNFS